MRYHPTKRSRRACSAVILIAALATLLAACGSSSKSSSNSSSGSPTGQVPPTQSMAPQTSVGKGEGSLNVIAWQGYTEPQWVKPFEQQTGCKVNAKYAGTSSDMVSLMANG